MARLARTDARSAEIRSFAAGVPNPFALDAWLRQAWTVVPDPPTAEFIRAPSYVLRSGAFEGDCDDAATFAGSVLLAMNWPAILIAIRQAHEMDFSHVFVRALGVNLDIDPIVPAELLPVRYGEAMVLAL